MGEVVRREIVRALCGTYWGLRCPLCAVVVQGISEPAQRLALAAHRNVVHGGQ